MYKLVLSFLLSLSVVSCTYFASNEKTDIESTQITQNQTVIKSQNDRRIYKSITLENKLKVLIISDPTTDKSAAALDVNIGSSDDPVEFKGLAHFLEHMLFLGTKKYPNPDEYQKFISDHGGGHNAFTALENTNFFFDIQADNFEGALDRFSEQFTHPLFNEDYVTREANAVHSEFTAKIKDDSRRFFSAIKEALSKGHPYKKFSVGNLETLKDHDGLKLREALLSFYHRHYSANQMRLVVLGKEPIGKLSEWVKAKFSSIPNKNIHSKLISQNFFDPGFLPAKIVVKSIMDKRSLSVAFPIPSAYELTTSQPITYLANLIGHEGKGSLLSELKSEGLVDTLSAGGQFDTHDKALFMLNMSLTKKGVSQQKHILELLFSYLDLIKNKGIQKVYFDELATMLKISFNYQEKSEPIHYVSSLAGALQNSDARTVLFRGYDLHDYEPELYRSYLDLLSPKNMLVAFMSKDVKGDKTSHWYNAPYKLSHFDDAFIASLTRPKAQPNLNVPEENIFIPENTNLLSLQQSKKPELLQHNKGIDIWYAGDNSFGTPKSNLFLSIRSPAAMKSAKNLNLTEIMASNLNDALNEYSYPALLAGLNYQLYNHMRGISIKISGYNDKQSALLDKILNTLKYAKFSDQRFSIIKERLKRKLQNAKEKKPYVQAIAAAQRILLNPSWDEQTRLKALENLNLADLENFRTLFLSEIDTYLLSSGNVTKETTLKIGQQIKDTLLKEVTISPVERAKVTKLNSKHNWLKTIEVQHPDTGFIYYLQGKDKTYTERAKMSLLTQILSTDYYALIRTEKQLGYIVFATNFSLLEVPAIAFIVQSPNTEGPMLVDETQIFLRQETSKINKLTEEDLERLKSGIISNLLKKDNTLYERSNRYWKEIDEDNLDFDTRQQLASKIKGLTLMDIRAFYKKISQINGNTLIVYSRNKASKTTDALANNNLTLLSLEKEKEFNTF